MANTNMHLGEWLIKQGSNGDIVVQNQDGSGVVVKSGSDDIVTHIFHWFLSDALLANAAQSEAVAASVGEGVQPIDSIDQKVGTAPPASAVDEFKARLLVALARVTDLEELAFVELAIKNGEFDSPAR